MTLGEFGEAEVEDLHVAFGADHDVLGFDVAMDDACFVCGNECFGNLNRDVEHVAEFHSVAAHALAQRHAFDVLHRDEWRPSSVSPISWTTQTFGWLSREAARASCVKRRRRSGSLLTKAGKHFQRHTTTENRVGCEIDLAHPTFADEIHDLVVLDALAGGEFLFERRDQSAACATAGDSMKLPATSYERSSDSTSSRTSSSPSQARSRNASRSAP